MKKLGLLIFIAALVIGSMAAIFSKVGKLKTNFGFAGTKGSGVMKSETRDVRDFRRIEISGAINAQIHVQNDFAVSVETDSNLIEGVKTVIEGDTLKIYREQGNVWGKNQVNIEIAMPNLDGLEVSGASKAEVFNAAGEELSLSASGASKIMVNGEVGRLKAEATGASTIKAEELKASTVETEATGASKTSVFATDSLSAEASGASRINYSGSPKNVDQSSTGASSITKN